MLNLCTKRSWSTLLLLSSVFIFCVPSLSLAAETVSPTTIPTTATTINIGQPTAGHSWRLSDPAGAFIYSSPLGNGDASFSIHTSTGHDELGIYHVVYYNTSLYPDCSGDETPDTYAHCISTGAWTTDVPVTVAVPVVLPPDPFANLFGFGTTTTTTAQYIISDNPAQDLFNGILLFMLSFFFVVWYFNGRFKLT